jgi:hypothetical protein
MLNYKEKLLNKQINDRFQILEEIDKNTSRIESFFNYSKPVYYKPESKEKPQKLLIKQIKKCDKKHSRNTSIDNKTTRTSTSISQRKKNSFYMFQDEDERDLIGQNLYKRGLEFNSKKERKIRDKRTNFYQGLTFKPKISVYSKEIQKRDPYKFDERLYNQSSKIMNISREKNTSFVDKEKSFHGKFKIILDTVSQIYPQKPKERDPVPFNYTPRLNQRSLQMAKTFGSSFERLTKHMTSFTRQDKSEDKTIASKDNTPKKYSFDKETLGHSLYERGLKSLKKKEKKISEREKSKENSHLSYSFKPKLNYSSEIRDSLSYNKRSVSNLNFLERMETFNYNKKRNIDFISKLVQIENSKTYTFKPKVTKSILKQEENEMFERSCKQIVEYSNKLKKYKDLKLQPNKKSVKQLNKYINKSPIKINRRSVSKEKTISPNQSVLHQRIIFKTQSFFNKLNLNDSYEYYFDGFSEIDQQNFLNALEKIKNLI